MKNCQGNDFGIGDTLYSYSAPLLKVKCVDIVKNVAEMMEIHREKFFKINQESLGVSHWLKESETKQ